MIEDVLGIQDAAMGLEREKNDSYPPPTPPPPGKRELIVYP